MLTRYQKVCRAFVVLGLLGFSGALITSCGGVRARRKTPQKAGFLRDYTDLKPRDGYDASLVYINPNTNWSEFNAVNLESVTIWSDPSTNKLSAEQRQMLTDFLFKAIHDKLTAANFRVVDRAGPGVITFRAAITEARGANVALKTITTVVPQMNIVSTIVGTGADVVSTVGQATIEAEFLDSLTHDRIAAAVDQRAGKKWVTQLKTWSDVKSACEFWADRIVNFLGRQGVQRAA